MTYFRVGCILFSYGDVMLKSFKLLTPEECRGIRVKSSYHTHNYLCGHAGGTVSDYACEAAAHGMTDLGISDHCECPLGGFEPYMTLSSMVTDYLPQFDRARAIYGDRIKIHSGAEIEYFDGHDDYYRTLLSRLDYLVLGQHEYTCGRYRRNSFCDGTDEVNIVAYCDGVISGLRSGFFKILAHPDLIFYRSPKLTARAVAAFENVIKQAKDCGVVVELNANGIRSHGFRYPTDLLVSLCKKYYAPVTVSSDAHSPEYLCDEYTLSLYNYAREQKLRLLDGEF